MRPSSRSEWQLKLCKVLVDVCLLGGSTKVNPSVIKETPNHLSFLQLEVQGDRNFVGNTLQWREIGFAIEIKGPKNEVFKKYYAIHLHLKRFRRSSCHKCTPIPSITSGTTKTKKQVFIQREKADFLHYWQHQRCDTKNECWSGCSPVAWAQVFGYYDRLGTLSNSAFSSAIYGDSTTLAPRSMKDDVGQVRDFVRNIRKQLKTYCGKDGAGYTSQKNFKRIESWFKKRQGPKAQVDSYFMSSKSLVSETVDWIKEPDYPVVLTIRLEVIYNKSLHSVVATGYKETSHRYRHCRRFLFWPTFFCSWGTDTYYQFFLRYGWENTNIKCHDISSDVLDAHVAYLS